MPTHASLTGADLHEPKGADAASANTTLIANGSGGTGWSKVGAANLNTATIFDTNKQTFTVIIDDPSGLFSKFVAVPWACTLDRVYAAIDAAPTGATLQVDIYNGPSTLIDSVSFATTATPGDTDTFTASSAFSAGGVLRIRNSTAIATSGSLVLTFTFTITA